MKAWLVIAGCMLAGTASANLWDFKEGSEWSGPGWYVVSVDEWNSAPMLDGSAEPWSKLLDAGPFASEAVCKTKLPKIPDGQFSEFTTTCERIDSKPDCTLPIWKLHCSYEKDRKKS